MQRSLGKMSVYKMFNWRDRVASTIQQTVSAFLDVGEAIATRWIQTPKGVLLLQMVPDNSASGAIYVFDRQRDDWYMLSFEGCEDQFTSEQFDRVFSEYKLFSYVDQPGLCCRSCSRPTLSPSRRTPPPPSQTQLQLQEEPPCVCPLVVFVRSIAA